MPLTPEQREERRSGIGGSDAAALMGRHPTKTPLRLWLDKKHGWDEEPEGEWIEWGNLLEDTIAQEAGRRLGEVVSVPTATIRHPLEPRMLANPDRLLSSGRVLECKNTSDIQWRASVDERARTDGVMTEHFWQVQHYMEVLNTPAAVVAYLIGGAKLELIEVRRSPAVGAALRKRIGEWWSTYIDGDAVPEEGTPEDRISALERIHAKQSQGMLRVDAESVIALARDYERRRADVKQAEAELEQAKANLCAVIGDAEGLDFGPIGKVTWRANKKGTRVLQVRLGADGDEE